MKNLIYYFSGTGNSLFIANKIVSKLENSEVVSIPKVIDKEIDFSNIERVGIVFPVYMWGLPLIVAGFAERLNIPKNVYLFSIANYGGSAGRSLLQLKGIFEKKGYERMSGFKVQMPGNYTPLYGAISMEKQNKMFSKFDKELDSIAGIIRNKSIIDIKPPFFLMNIACRIFYNMTAPKIPSMDKAFWADSKCNSCEICVKVCPKQNISITEGKPKWNNKCEQCLACLQWCPQEAIQFNKATMNKKRYHHPDIKLSDIIA
ncbi:MAG: EFR1 family ferrodoxin [Elusimicrobiota bacterium]